MLTSLVTAATLTNSALLVTYPEINVGDKQAVLVNTRLSGDRDWLGIYPKGSDNSWSNVIAWNWATYGDVSLNKIKKEMPVGEYDIRLFFHNGFVEEKRTHFYVIDAQNNDRLSVSNIQAQNITENSALIVWDGSKYATGQVEYGETSTYGLFNTKETSFDYQSHGQALRNLKAGTTYHYRVISEDAEGNAMVSDDNIFTTLGNDAIKKYPQTTILEKRLTDNNIPRPTVGNPSLDNVFGTQIKMVDKTGNAASPYPKLQAWNSDMTLIRIKFRLYNAMTLEESPITKGFEVGGGAGTYNKLCAPLSSDFRWSSKDPNTFYVLNSSLQLIEGHIVGGTTSCETVLFDFKQNNFEQAAIGPGEGNIDFNDKYIALPVKKKGDDKIYIFLYDLEKKKKVWNSPKLYNAQDAHWEASGKYWKPTVLDWVSVSPSGKYIVINDSKTGMYRYDIHFKNKRRLEFYKDGQITSQGGHGDIGFDTNNNEVFVQFIAGRGVYSFNLDNPNEKGKELLNSPYGGGFVSCRNKLHRGWCYVTTRTAGFQEIYALKLDGIQNNVVQRFTQTHGNYYGGIASPDGTKILFSNYWGTDKLDTFVAELQP